MPRLFVGIELPESLKASALGACADYPALRWQQASQLHLTLRFQGDLPQQRLAELENALEAVDVPRFEMAIKGVGCFGSVRSPSILWAGVWPTEPLQLLRACIDTHLLPLGLVADNADFRPHVTLARLRPPAADATGWLTRYAGLASRPAEIASFSLVASVPSAAGSRYNTIRRYGLS
ncbi:2'-5' RNA ligase [Halopseudomonas xinjiangensis]|uniref:RNA 2',3'-cyclic phosphodiesterase n=1 Tax=Halopseudomonas xinjiangensis TaxID=487184 RepID=A0A1H1W7J4_9GAMM|nr:RNA 2',3'-cyclic phosphodiesterase [Halopseudomonas xinjiangensis]SDS93147.1 2'-5' RNA ligase [Halopseudomonas xinjiangensis]